jgi:hypothetical protein
MIFPARIRADRGGDGGDRGDRVPPNILPPLLPLFLKKGKRKTGGTTVTIITFRMLPSTSYLKSTNPALGAGYDS